MLSNSLINKFSNSSTELLNAKQKVLIEALVKNNFDNIDPVLYSNMAVPDIVEAMDEAYKRLALFNSTDLGKALG